MEVFVLMVYFCILGFSQEAVYQTPEEEALNFVFGEDSERHQGVERLHWHEEHLKAAAAILHGMNDLKHISLDHSYANVWDNQDDNWRMLDIMLQYNIWAEDNGLKWDTFHGDKHILWKVRRYLSVEEMTEHVQKYISLYGNDYIKYYAMDPDFNYTINNAERFAKTMITFTSPDDLSEIEMSPEQFIKYSEGSLQMILLNRDHIEIPILMLEVVREMVSLGLIDHLNEPEHPTGSS